MSALERTMSNPTYHCVYITNQLKKEGGFLQNLSKMSCFSLLVNKGRMHDRRRLDTITLPIACTARVRQLRQLINSKELECNRYRLPLCALPRPRHTKPPEKHHQPGRWQHFKGSQPKLRMEQECLPGYAHIGTERG